MNDEIESIKKLLNTSRKIGSLNELIQLDSSNILEQKLEEFMVVSEHLTKGSSSEEFGEWLDIIYNIFEFIKDYKTLFDAVEEMLHIICRIIFEIYIPEDFYEDNSEKEDLCGYI